MLLLHNKGRPVRMKALLIILETVGDLITFFKPFSSFKTIVDWFISVWPPSQFNTVVVLF